MTSRPIVHGVQQAGIYASSPDTLAAFYRDVIGLYIVGQGELDADNIRSAVLLSNHPDQLMPHLEIYARPDNRHFAFRVNTLTHLRKLYQGVVGHGLPIRWMLNHGTSLAFYFEDPADNLVKIFWPTGINYPQPHSHPIDLGQSEATLRQETENIANQLNPRRG